MLSEPLTRADTVAGIGAVAGVVALWPAYVVMFRTPEADVPKEQAASTNPSDPDEGLARCTHSKSS